LPEGKHGGTKKLVKGQGGSDVLTRRTGWQEVPADVGPLLWGVLIGRAGMRFSFVVASICCVASMGLLLLAMRAHASMGGLHD
jgi:hypothetical protein